MINLNHALPRRTFLRGLGATLALPLLDSMAPARPRSRAPAPPIRLGYVYTPNGIIGACDKSPRPFMWTPKTAGANFEFSPTMKALEPFRDQINVFSGLAQVNGPGARRRPGRPRARDGDVPDRRPPEEDRRRRYPPRHLRRSDRGEGARQIHAVVLARARPRAAAARRQLRLRLHLRLHVDVVARADQPAAGGNQSAHRVRAAVRRRRQHRRGRARWPGSNTRRACSTTSPAACRVCACGIGTGDKRKLEEYLEAVRDIERRIQRAEEQNATLQLPSIERPGAIPDDYMQYTKLMIDLQVVAWQTDMTRVVVVHARPRRQQPRVSARSASPTATTPISHHQSDPEKIEKLIKIDELHVEMFAYLLEKLKATPDGDGTLLDHSLVLFGSSISESNIHTHDDLPIVLAGGANGQLQGQPPPACIRRRRRSTTCS